VLIVSLLEWLVAGVGVLLVVNLVLSAWLGAREARRWAESEAKWDAFLRHWRADHDRVSLVLSSLEALAVEQLAVFKAGVRERILVGSPPLVPAPEPFRSREPHAPVAGATLSPDSPAFKSWSDVVKRRAEREQVKV